MARKGSKNVRNGTKMQKRANGMRGSMVGCCGCPCYALSSMVRGIGRCLFVSCYPVIQCCGWDEQRHHHHHKHFY